MILYSKLGHNFWIWIDCAGPDRKFGVSKRVSLSEKREIATLIAIELEMTVSECKHETELVQVELDEMRDRLHQLEQKSRHVFATLRDFARKHETQLTSHAHDLTTTTELMRQMQDMIRLSPDDSSVLPMLHTYLTAFLQQVRRILYN